METGPRAKPENLKKTKCLSIKRSLVAWLIVAIVWLFTTRNNHPTMALAIIVTASLMCAYAGATYINHLLLIPSFWKEGYYGQFAVLLLATMALLTGLALVVIRFSYFFFYGPDPDPYGVYVHYGIDFVGMLVHVLCAAGIVWVYSRLGRST